ncbi:MAG: TonB-dependent receptor [Bacteroidia bacterium]
MFHSGNFGNVFRLPTVNDLYWIPGGNPDLLPETGTTGEIGLHLLNTQLSMQRSSVAYFDKHINNWIAWVPTGSFDLKISRVFI